MANGLAIGVVPIHTLLPEGIRRPRRYRLRPNRLGRLGNNFCYLVPFMLGVIIPPVKLVADGKIVPDVFRLVLAQIRSKHKTAGLPRAGRREYQVHSTGARRAARSGTIVTAMGDLLDSQRRTRAELAALPHGTWHAEGVVDNDGYTDQPVHLEARVTNATDGAHFDTTGSDPQRRAPVNSTYAMTFSACAYALKCLIDPDLPVNDGFYRVITVEAPEGTVTNALWPCTVAAGLSDRIAM